ncbi:hypothetical protein WJX84_008391 [Apatococcus fuscideae]|uniref:Uncharacterized protein n=1 Tax=Apatococcus fuscideae TaxID=2026836 RepID=A0AAW1SY28_9CHLO
MTVKEQILAEARRIAAQGGSFVFPPLQQKLSQPRPSLEAAKPALAQAVSKRPVDQQPISAEADAKRPRLAPVQEKLFAAVPLQERPNVVWIKDSQVPLKTRQPTLNRLLGQHLAAGLLQSLQLDAILKPKSAQKAVRERAEIRAAAIQAALAQELSLYKACASSPTVYRNLAARTTAAAAASSSEAGAVTEASADAAATAASPPKIQQANAGQNTAGTMPPTMDAQAAPLEHAAALEPDIQDDAAAEIKDVDGDDESMEKGDPAARHRDAEVSSEQSEDADTRIDGEPEFSQEQQMAMVDGDGAIIDRAELDENEEQAMGLLGEEDPESHVQRGMRDPLGQHKACLVEEGTAQMIMSQDTDADEVDIGE